MPPRPPAAPSLPLGTALGQSEPLARLMQRLRESNACLEAVRPLLPAGLLEQVRAGPLDDSGWTLLVSNSAAAAKLRQFLPSLEATMLERWRRPVAIKIRIQPKSL